jgi:hypothetical protein
MSPASICSSSSTREAALSAVRLITVNPPQFLVVELVLVELVLHCYLHRFSFEKFAQLADQLTTGMTAVHRVNRL